MTRSEASRRLYTLAQRMQPPDGFGRESDAALLAVGVAGDDLLRAAAEGADTSRAAAAYRATQAAYDAIPRPDPSGGPVPEALRVALGVVEAEVAQFVGDST